MIDNSKNKYYNDIINILSVITEKITPQTNVNWTSYSEPNELIGEIESYINALKQGDSSVLEKIKFHFLPTSTFQELAATNDWSEEYLRLADKFEILHEKLIK